MPNQPSRRAFLQVSATATSTILAENALSSSLVQASRPIRVVVWDEQQREQKQAYDNFLGNWIASYLKEQPGIEVKSVRLDDPEQGLAAETLAACDVLIWWGHQRQAEIKPEIGKKLVERIKAGTLSLIALHSAHWSTPFVEAMNEVTRLRTERDWIRTAEDKNNVEITYVPPSPRYAAPGADARITPCTTAKKYPAGKVKVTVHLPNCCFPGYRPDGKPSQIRVLKPDHPIVKGLPKQFELPHTEMYNEPFHIPTPDEVILEERWAPGEWFRGGMIWQLGKGRVFYFRPGHETFAIYKEKPALQIVENAVRWLASV